MTRKHLHQITTDLDGPTIFYGNENLVAEALRLRASETCQSYLEITATSAESGLAQQAADHERVAPVWVHFTVFDDAHPGVQAEIIKLIRDRSPEAPPFVISTPGKPPAGYNPPPGACAWFVSDDALCQML